MRCYFHLFSDHEEILDEVGIEVTDLEQAKTEALKAINELRLEIGEEVEDWSTWRLEIVCPQGTLLHSMPLKIRSTEWRKARARPGESPAFHFFLFQRLRAMIPAEDTSFSGQLRTRHTCALAHVLLRALSPHGASNNSETGSGARFECHHA
jgi:hypothetical protein